MEPCRSYIAVHGEAAEVDRYQWFPGARDMGGGVEGGCGYDPLPAGNYSGVWENDRRLTRIADSGAG